MTELEKTLSRNFAPAPRADLADRILATAQNMTPANDRPARRSWWGVGSVAAMAIAAVLFVAQPTPDLTEADEWEQVAEASGFSDLYDWVETEAADS